MQDALSRFDYISTIPTRADILCRVGLNMAKNLSRPMAEAESQRIQRALKVLIAVLREANPDVEVPSKIAVQIEAMYQDIVDDLKVSSKAGEWTASYLTRLANTLHKFVRASAMLEGRSKVDQSDLARCRPFVDRMVHSLQGLVAPGEVPPGSWTVC